jgi:hypothetical protein
VALSVMFYKCQTQMPDGQSEDTEGSLVHDFAECNLHMPDDKYDDWNKVVEVAGKFDNMKSN